MKKVYKASCKEEEKFLEQYDPKAFDPIALSVDAVVLGVMKSETDNYRKLDK